MLKLASISKRFGGLLGTGERFAAGGSGLWWARRLGGAQAQGLTQNGNPEGDAEAKAKAEKAHAAPQPARDHASHAAA